MLFLIGHRGVGKTSLLKNINNSLDLDAEISKTHKISSFFENGQEDKFRVLEHEVLNKVLKNKKIEIISLGAGFELDKFVFPENSKIIWVQRKSDKNGRIFLDRPRLNTNVSFLDEYLERFSERQKLYQEYADFSLELEEGGVETALPVLQRILLRQKIFSNKAYYTIGSVKELSFFRGQIELRTDLLSEHEIENLIFSQNKHCDFLVSIRTDVSDSFFEKILDCKDIFIDLPIEKGFFDDKKIDKNKNIFISSHEELSGIEIQEINKKGFHVKWAPLINSFEELKKKLELIKDLDVSFLPRSVEKGKWKWCRQTLLLKNKINFYRTGLREYLDQPNIIDLEKPVREGFLGAVLGEDVSLSHSPFFHTEYFQKEFQSSYFSVCLGRDEFTKENLLFLKEVGFSFFSVTAPFKKELKAFGKMTSANTVFIDDKNVIFTEDTDVLAVKDIVSKFKETKVLIWGAGDMGNLFLKAFEEGVAADIISVRDYDGRGLDGFETLIWCSGLNSGAVPNFKKPPVAVVDLEYKEQSPAREVALSCGSKYISGKSFFETQALAQQKFWAKK